MKYVIKDPDYVKDLKNPRDVDSHLIAFINYVNDLCFAKKYEFLGFVYDPEYTYGAKLVFKKSDVPHCYRVVNKFLPNEEGFKFCIDMGALFGRFYIYTSEFSVEEATERLKKIKGKTPKKEDVLKYLGRSEKNAGNKQ